MGSGKGGEETLLGSVMSVLAVGFSACLSCLVRCGCGCCLCFT